MALGVKVGPFYASGHPLRGSGKLLWVFLAVGFWVAVVVMPFVWPLFVFGNTVLGWVVEIVWLLVAGFVVRALVKRGARRKDSMAEVDKS